MPPIVTQIITSYGGLSKEHNPIAAIRQHLVGMCPKVRRTWQLCPKTRPSRCSAGPLTALGSPHPPTALLQLSADGKHQRHQSEGL